MIDGVRWRRRRRGGSSGNTDPLDHRLCICARERPRRYPTVFSSRGRRPMATTASPIGTSTGTLDNYYYASPGGITYLGNNDATDGGTRLIIPTPQLLFPVNSGQVAGIVGTNLPLGNATQGNPITGNL